MTEKHHHFKLYKPDGYLSQFVNNSKKRRNKKLLGELYEFPNGTMPIGRLDEMSEGLLLLTTDGQLSYEVNTSGIEKEYYAQVDGVISQDAVEKMKMGVEISINGKPYTTKPCKASLVNKPPNFPDRQKPIRDERHGMTSWVKIVLTEGKFRQVRKMTAKVGFPTLRLVRVRIGGLHLATMKPGDVEAFEKSAVGSGSLR